MVDPIPVRSAEFDAQQSSRRPPHERRSRPSRNSPERSSQQGASSDEQPDSLPHSSDSAIGSQLDMEV
jgi:hypothetical protein